MRMKFKLEEAIPLLRKTPLLMKVLLKDLPKTWTQDNYTDLWSPFDIIGHLIHGERTDWLPRTRIILSNVSDKTFEPFDRFAQFENSKGETMDDLLLEFESLRKKNMEELLSFSLSKEQLMQEGKHPEFGKVTLEELLSSWVVHDMAHIAQMVKVMASRYREEVGPWASYMNILK